jgi:predicted acylesterase/phospholipase RssA
VGGASIGGILAAQVAAGWSPERMLEVNREEWQRTRIDRAWTLPLIALTSPSRQVRMLERMFGDVRIEDLWLPYFCVTVNLSRCELAVHRHGSLVQWANATAAPPALQPPVVGEGGELYVDGGVLDNLPTDVMCASGSGPVVAINVSPFQEMTVDAREREAPSSFRFLMGALTRRPSSFPNIVKVIYRTAKVTGLQREAANRKLASLYLEPPLDGFGLTDYAAIDRIVEIGYRHASERLEQERDLVAEWSSW